MRKFVVAVAGMAVVVVALFALSPQTAAQTRGRPRVAAGARGFGASIGVSVRDLQNDEASRAKVSGGGVYVEDVSQDGPAARAGIKTGDIVIEFDGERVRSALHFTRLVRETVAGTAVKVTVVRDGNRQMLDVTPEDGWFRFPPVPDVSREIERGLRNLPRDFSFDFDFEGFGDGFSVTRGRLGATLMPVTDQLAEYFGVKQGLLVTAVAADTAASSAGLKAGDVLTAVNGTMVERTSDVSRALRDVPGGGKVELRVMRDRKELTLNTTLPERQRNRARRDRDRIPV
jgi:serine protease Do